MISKVDSSADKETKTQLQTFFDTFKGTLTDYERFSTSEKSEPDEDECAQEPDEADTENFEVESESKEKEIKETREKPASQKDSQDLKSLLMAKLTEKKKPTAKHFHFNISKTISVDSQVLNFGSFYPEKLLGSLLLVQNTTETD